MGKTLKKINNYAFTLIEILIVIALIGGLTSLSYLFIPAQLEKSRDTRRKLDLLKIKRALADYYDCKTIFPDTLPNCDSPLEIEGRIILNSVPCDPITKEKYWYESPGEDELEEWFKLYTNLENEKDPSIEYVGCTYGCGPDCEYNFGLSSTNKRIDICEVPQYVCSPGGGQEGSCELFDDPDLSECPIIFSNDPTCQNKCGDPGNRCKNSRGKHVPE